MTLQSLQYRGLQSSSRAVSWSPPPGSSSSPDSGTEASCPKGFCGGSCKVPGDLEATDIGEEDEGLLGGGSPACCKRIIGEENLGHNPGSKQKPGLQSESTANTQEKKN